MPLFADCGPRLLSLDALPMVVDILNVSSTASAKEKALTLRINSVTTHANFIKVWQNIYICWPYF